MSFAKLFSGALTAATLSISLLGMPSAFAASSTDMKMCRDANSKEWLYDSNGLDCNGVDRDGKVGAPMPTPANPSNPTCKDSKGIWLYDSEGFDCNKVDRDGKVKGMIINPTNPITPAKDVCRDAAGAWIYGYDGFDCNNVDRDGKTKGVVVAPKPPTKCDAITPWEYTKQVVNGKEYMLDKNGYTPDGYYPANDTWYKTSPEDKPACEKDDMIKPEKVRKDRNKYNTKKRMTWKDGRPVAPVTPAKY
jgi:hypothetical protein